MNLQNQNNSMRNDVINLESYIGNQLNNINNTISDIQAY